MSNVYRIKERARISLVPIIELNIYLLFGRMEFLFFFFFFIKRIVKVSMHIIQIIYDGQRAGDRLELVLDTSFWARVLKWINKQAI